MSEENTKKEETEELKRTYKRANGTEATYKVAKGGTANDKMSDDLDATRTSWKEEGCIQIKNPTKAKIEGIKLSSIVRYITKDGKARRGGNLIAVSDDYFRLLNPTAGVSWSCQYKNIEEIWHRPKLGKAFFKKKEKK